MRACWLKWVGRDWSISADYIWLNYSGANNGNIDKDFKGAAILDLLLLRYLVYAMQLKRIGVSAANTRRAINELFGLMYYLPAEDGDTETVAKNTEINEPNNETEGNADEIVEAE